jgi:hypothetical protein
VACDAESSRADMVGCDAQFTRAALPGVAYPPGSDRVGRADVGGRVNPVLMPAPSHAGTIFTNEQPRPHDSRFESAVVGLARVN